MKTTTTSLLIFLLFLQLISGAFGIWGSSSNHERIQLKKGDVITFEEGRYTAARRVSAIPQLAIVGGSAKLETSLYPTVVQCTAVGNDAYDMQWECKADLDQSVRLGKTEVVCEGYSSSEDPYILRGSCGLEYRLEYTHANRNQNSYSSVGNYNSNSTGTSWGKLFMFAVVAYIIYSIIKQCKQNSQRNLGRGSSGGPGHFPGGDFPHGGNNNDHGNDFPGYPKDGTSASSYGNQQQPQQPGFWSGFGIGGLASYLLGRMMRPNYNSYGNYGGGYSSGFRSYGGGGSSFRSSSSSFRSSGTRSSSGFGGTRRR